MNYNCLVIKEKDHIGWIQINRPKKLNALNAEVLEEIHHVLLSLRNNKAIRVVVLYGSGTKSFVAGADISEFVEYDEYEGEEMSSVGHQKVFNFIEQFNKPVIAAINGYALGGGLELALACHIRIASENAQMGLPEVTLGLIPGYGGTQRLPQIIGKGRALEMMLNAKMISSKKALLYGLVTAVYPQEKLLEEAYNLAEKLIQNSPNAIHQVIRTVNSKYDENKNGFEEEIRNFGACFQTPDFIEGTDAFLSKKKPKFD